MYSLGSRLKKRFESEVARQLEERGGAAPSPRRRPGAASRLCGAVPASIWCDDCPTVWRSAADETASDHKKKYRNQDKKAQNI